MTTPIAMTTMNKALPADTSDMPHVLGDPVDAAWQGSAERINANFTATKNYLATIVNPQSRPGVSGWYATGTNAMQLATGWSFANPNTAATVDLGPGYAFARKVLLGGALGSLMTLSAQVWLATVTGGPKVSDAKGIFPAGGQVDATKGILLGYFFTVGGGPALPQIHQYRGSALFESYGFTSPTYYEAHCAGSVYLNQPEILVLGVSAPNLYFASPTRVTFNVTALTV